MGKTIIKIGDHLMTEIDYHHNKTMLDVEFGQHYQIQITKVNENEWKVTNAANGYGENVYDQLKSEVVEIGYESSLDQIEDREFKTYLDSDEPLLIMIKETRGSEEKRYHVIWEDPFDSGYEVMTAKQIFNKYKIEL